jgi:hypothetical protein
MTSADPLLTLSTPNRSWPISSPRRARICCVPCCPRSSRRLWARGGRRDLRRAGYGQRTSRVPARVSKSRCRYPLRQFTRVSRGDPETAVRVVFPGLVVGAAETGRAGADVGGRDALPAGGVDPPDGDHAILLGRWL